MKDYEKAKTGNGFLFVAVVVVGLAALFSQPAKADEAEFMAMETGRQRIVEANGECELHGQMGADLQARVSAYYCTNFGDCDGQNMQPIESTPWGVYRDSIGGGK